MYHRTHHYLPPKFVPHREHSTTFRPSLYLTESTVLPSTEFVLYREHSTTFRPSSYLTENAALPSAQVRTSQRTQHYLSSIFVPHRQHNTTFRLCSHFTENKFVPHREHNEGFHDSEMSVIHTRAVHCLWLDIFPFTLSCTFLLVSL